MRNTVQRHAIVLAALLQVLPIVRNFFANPAATSSFAWILKLGIGAGAVTGAYDSISRASAPVIFTTPTNFIGTLGVYFTNSVAITNNGGDKGAFFVLTNKFGIISSAISNGISTTNCMPPGLTFRCYDGNNGGSPQLIYGAITGIPTTLTTNFFIHVLAGYTGQVPAQTNIYITIASAPPAVPPVITNQPAGLTNMAGTAMTLTTVAGGNPAVSYQWRQGTTPLNGATNTSLTFANVRANQAGTYFVVVTNTAGAVTSSPAMLMVTNPPPPPVSAPGFAGGQFNFTFKPVPGLTNTVMTNGDLANGTWAPFTNIPPPANSNPITISNQMGLPKLFYRLMVVP